MTDRQTVEISAADYVAGQIPLVGWSDGEYPAKLDDGTTRGIKCQDSRTTTLAVWVWNRLWPGAKLEISAMPPKGKPAWIRRLPPAPPTQRPLAAAPNPEMTLVDLLDEIRRALERLGGSAAFEQLWAYLESRGLRLPPGELALLLPEAGIGIGDEGRLLECGSIWDGVGWDSPEDLYWRTLACYEPPSLDPVYGKRNPSLFDGLEYHMDEVRHRLMKAEEEQESASRIQIGLEAQQELHRGGHDHDAKAVLGDAIRAGDLAREELVSKNLRLVVNIAKRYVRRIDGTSLDLADLVQAGYLGLLHAVERFDPERGHRFSTYATWWIRQAITRDVATHSRTVRVPVHVHDEIERVRKAANRGEDISAGLSGASEAAGVENHIQMLELWDRFTVPLDDVSTEFTLFALDAARGVVDPVTETVLSNTNSELVRRVLNELDERQRLVLTQRFGLDGGGTRTLEEVGRTLSVTRERVRQLEGKALAALRTPRIAELLGEPASVPNEQTGDDSGEEVE